jgi:hypothetical protein
VYKRQTNALLIEFSVYNRWGELVYDGKGISPVPAWDGKSNGNEVSEGIYFVQYKVTGYNNQVLEGQSFVHLIRD